MNCDDLFEKRVALVNQELEQRLPPATQAPRLLHEAMRHSVMAGGKRLRPLLCMAAAEAAGAPAESALAPALALEVLHTYTLIHDDLPAMDNDDLRRGRPTCHVVYGEAIAILAGDALLTLAFEWLASEPAPAPHPPCRLAMELAGASGSMGVIAGQVEDILAEGKPPDALLLRRVHELKTAALLRAAARMGAVAAGAPETIIAGLDEFAGRIGLAFQIVDDILNATSDPATLGKSVGSDQARGKLTYVSVYGLEESQRKAENLMNEALAFLKNMPGETAALSDLAHRIVRRIS